MSLSVVDNLKFRRINLKDFLSTINILEIFKIALLNIFNIPLIITSNKPHKNSCRSNFRMKKATFLGTFLKKKDLEMRERTYRWSYTDEIPMVFTVPGLTRNTLLTDVLIINIIHNLCILMWSCFRERWRVALWKKTRMLPNKNQMQLSYLE